ncbi:hypothetical protein [Olleya sp. Hel_I_94]|uniref:hypothetical protein n=1 Tax=Olleya sp. Hel_I_94 TaxID=1250001 RepID=UPI0011A29666|nr:hypothetical protein [Olleya sp. Hel_I_94]TVZ49853.1 hypothetical protein JM82_0292 [Olleya sp. Hel_I_94]
MNSEQKIKILSEKLEDEIINSLREKADDNPMKGTPLESMFYLEIMNNTTKEFKNFLNGSKVKFDLTNEDIEKIGSKGYTAVYSKLFDENSEEDIEQDDEYPSTSQEELEEDEKKIKLLFYQFCFDEEVTELFIEDSQNNRVIRQRMAETTTISESITYSLFKSYLKKSNIEFTETDITKFRYKNFEFRLMVDRVVIGDDSNYLEILTNDFSDIPNEDDLPLALANNFVVYVENFKPKFLYAVIKDPFLGKYALRKIATKGISSNVTFMRNNERDTIVDAVLEYNN